MTVIKIENLWKEYRLGVIGHGTLTHDLQSWWARVRSKDDPNAKVASMLLKQEQQIEGDHFWALQNINLEVKQGEIVGIVGKNGAGKSTLLKVFSRVTSPTRGHIKIKGKIASLLEVGTGFHPELTGRENVFMNGAILGMSKWDIEKKLDEIIDFSGIEQFVDTPVKRYSSGMYVRLAFAVAAHLEPEILVLDEVLAVGDAAFQKKCLGKMGEVSRDGRTILFVSHNMNAIQELCDRAILLSAGTKKIDDSVSRVVGAYLSNEASQASLVDLDKLTRETKQEYSKLTRFAMMDADHSLVTHFKMGDALIVNVEVEILKYMEAVEIGVKISSKQGIAIHYLTSSWEGIRENLDPGAHVFEMCVTELLLYPGKYQVGLWILRDGEWSDDHVQEITYFDVIKADITGFKTRIEKYSFSGCEVYTKNTWKKLSKWRKE